MQYKSDKAILDVCSRAARLFSAIGWPAAGAELVPLGLGGNNRIYLVETGARTYVLKEYFRHPGDTRDRLGSEFALAKFAWTNGLRCIPEAIACDTTEGLGLFGFIEGEQILPGTLSRTDISQARAFIASLNRFRETPEARELPLGSEACFSIHQHLAVVKRRIDRINGIIPALPIDQEALAFVKVELAPAFGQITEKIMAQLTEEGIEPDAELLPAQRVISPSDFGFHNALRRPDGTIAFLDFEYAGWDDPAKLTGDFFSQVAVPVPITYKDEVLASIADIFSERESTLRRMNFLLPVYRIKWCCILLNHFLPVASDRRIFAQGAAGKQKKEQLAKAKQLLASLQQLEAGRKRN